MNKIYKNNLKKQLGLDLRKSVKTTALAIAAVLISGLSYGAVYNWW